MARSERTLAETKATLQELDEYEFEHFVGDLWARRGYRTAVSQASQDLGVDVEAWDTSGPFERKEVIQAKRYGGGNTVGRPEVQQYHAMKVQDPEADIAVVVTTSAFASTAEAWARDHNVKLVDGDDLAELVVELDAHDLVNRYVAGTVDPTTPDASSDTETDAPTGATGPKTDSVTTADNRYVAVVAGAVLVQLLMILSGISPSFLPFLSADAATWIVVLLWFATPPALFLDALTLHRNGALDPPNRVIWPVASFFIPVIVPAYYLLVRF